MTLFYRQVRLLVLVLCLVVVDGMTAYNVLPRLEDPELSARAAAIITRLPGASAERVEALITEKIENELSEIEELGEVRSTSRPGLSSIILEVKDETTNFAEVWAEVRAELDDVENFLPEGASKPEFNRREARAFAALVALSWEGEGEANAAILARQARDLEEALRSISGTEEVKLYGLPEEEIEVLLNPVKVRALNLTAQDVAGRVLAADVKAPSGQLRTEENDILFELDELRTLEQIGQIPIKSIQSTGQIVYLTDVATLAKSRRNPPRQKVLVHGKESVVVAAKVVSETRVDLWSRALKEKLERFRERLPARVTLDLIFEQSRYTEARLLDLRNNLLLGAALVALVVLVTMGWRSALAISLALPLTSLMVLSGMKILAIPIHQMSVMGIIIALGLLIDNAIVTTDEVRTRTDQGLDDEEAIRQTIRHLGVPLLSSTFTTVLAFMPLVLMPGPAGEFVGSVSVTVILALTCSLFLSLLIIPVFYVRMRRLPTLGSEGWWWNSGFSLSALSSVYRRALVFLFRLPPLAILLGLALPILGFSRFSALEEQFFPPSDRGQCEITLELAPQASLAQTEATAREMSEVITGQTRATAVHWFLGRSGATFYYNLIALREDASSFAQAMVEIDPEADPILVIRDLQRELDARFPEVRTLVRQLEQGPPFDAPVEIRIYGPDLEVLRQLGEEVRRVLTTVPEVTHTRASLGEDLAKLRLQPDLRETRLSGLTELRLAQLMQDTLEGTSGGSVLEATEELPVRIRMEPEVRSDLDRLRSLDVVSNPDSSLPVIALGDVELIPAPAVVPRRDRRRLNTVQAFVVAGVLPSKVVSQFKARLKESDLKLPPGYELSFGGESAERDEAVGSLLASAGALVVLMASTLIMAFRSVRIAGLIGVVGVLSIGLSLGALWLFGYPFGFMAIVGAMGLVGVAINDSIVVIAAIRDDAAASTGDPEAMASVVVHSTRHVLTTTLTTIAGFTPLVVAGSSFWAPLAIAVAGGVGGATILAIFFCPAVYRILFFGPLGR